MKGKSLIAENLELAYQTWRKCGQSPVLTIKTLNEEHEFNLSRVTLDAWIKDNGWKERADRAEEIERRAKDPNLSGEEKMISALVSEQQKYETYFETVPIVQRDPQMTYAYTHLITTVQNIRQKTAAHKAEMFTAFMRDLIGWLNLNDPGSVPAIEKNFDDFIAFAKEKYRT